MTTRPTLGGIERLQALIDVHGGDRERWPAADRLEMARLIASDERAAALVAEAQAFERVLDEAPSLPAERLAALTQRIVASARHEGRWQGETTLVPSARYAVPSGSAVPADLPAAHEALCPERATPAWRIAAGRGPLASAAMLTASFIIGIIAGATVLSGDVLGSGRALSDAGYDTVIQQLVMGDDGLDASAEDLL